MNINKTLSISDKLAAFEDSFWNEHVPAFDSTKNELTAVHPNSTHSYITDLNQIAQHVNTLSKPIYKEIDKFYGFFRNIEKINELVQQQENPVFIDTNSFCLALRPSSAELTGRVWAVQVSDYLWPEAVMKPFKKILGTQEKAPGFSFTLHFSLGEMVRPHSYNLNWKYNDIAVITPLSELTEKLAGIYPYDSFMENGKFRPKQSSLFQKTYMCRTFTLRRALK